jgi:uncharacterized membrane protein
MGLSNWRDEIINNKKDPRLLIPRPYPRVGWTLNFGQPLTWIFIIVVVLVLVLCGVFVL